MNKDVLFLGSGFSKAIDNSFPTLKELSQQINKSFTAEKLSVGIHYKEEIPLQYKDNIEILLTFLSSSLPYKTDVQISADEALYKDISFKIANYFYSIDKRSRVQEYFEKTVNLIKYIFDNKLTCITLNYDLLLELLLSQYALNYLKFENCFYEDFYRIPIKSILMRVATVWAKDTDYNAIPTILKLHGSINWLYDTQTENADVYCEMQNEEVEQKQLIDIAKSGLSPLIIPPVLNKTQTYKHNIIKTIWKNAFNVLSEANNIYICGFSFPQTDVSIKFLVQSALNNNKNKPNIYVINTEESLDSKSSCYIKTRYEDIFRGYSLNFDYCCDDSLSKFTKEIIEPKIKKACLINK